MRKSTRNILIGAGVVGAVSAVAAYNKYLIYTAPELDSLLPGESRHYLWEGNSVFYKVQGKGQPLLLVHSINAAASSYEWRKTFASLARQYRVYAFDLPGFGQSSRSGILYSSAVYRAFLVDFVRDVIGVPVSAIGSSLGAAYLVAAAYQEPSLFSRLVLISPTGLENLNTVPGPGAQLLTRFLRLPLVGPSLANILTSYRSIAYFLQRYIYARPEMIDTAMVEQNWLTGHQPGAQWAPISFLTGYLNQDLRPLWPDLSQPTWLAWGENSKLNPVEEAAEFLRLRPATTLKVFADAGSLVQDEAADAFNAWLSEIWPA